MKKLLPAILAATLVSVSGALADDAANAYVSIDAPGARNEGGVDFAVKNDKDSTIVTVKAQPGWTLTSPTVVEIPKGSAGSWSAKSFYGESSSSGEICVPTTSVSTNHLRAPEGSVKLFVNHGQGNGAKDSAKDNGNGDKERGGVINIGASIKGLAPGLHRVTATHDTCPGGKSNRHSENKRDFSVNPDTYKWTWSVGGQSGTATGSTLLVSGIKLERGKYTVTVSVAASSSLCSACSASASASKEINIGNGVIK